MNYRFFCFIMEDERSFHAASDEGASLRYTPVTNSSEEIRPVFFRTEADASTYAQTLAGKNPGKNIIYGEMTKGYMAQPGPVAPFVLSENGKLPF